MSIFAATATRIENKETALSEAVSFFVVLRTFIGQSRDVYVMKGKGPFIRRLPGAGSFQR